MKRASLLLVAVREALPLGKDNAIEETLLLARLAAEPEKFTAEEMRTAVDYLVDMGVAEYRFTKYWRIR